MQSHARRFRTVNLVCDPLLDRPQLLLALVLVTLILVGVIHYFHLLPLMADIISFCRVTSRNSGRATNRT
jgi:ABC-type antimicrobial peptide transport system permease subunit